METLFDWYIKERVLLQRPQGELTIEDVQHNNDRIIKMLDKGRPLVHVVVDARFITKLPTNLLKMSNATSFLNHPSLGWVVTVSNNSMINFLGGMLPQIGTLRRYRVFSDLDRTVTFLKDQDTSLDWASAKSELII